MEYRVLIPEPVSEVGTKYLRDKGYEVRIGSGTTTEVIKKEVADCHAILARTALLPAEILEAGKNLKVIARHGVGVDNIDLEGATRLGIQVTNAPESNANSVAEHTIGLILAVTKNLVLGDQELRGGNFSFRNQKDGIELEGRTLGIIGVGRIGRLVAGKASAGLGMKVIGFDPYATAAPGVEMFDTMDEVLKASDVVSIHVPATDETKGLIGKNELELMKTGAYLVNAARGGIIDETDLAVALEQGSITGAALDVFAEEPPDTTNPLFKMRNVVVTPHNASMTSEAKDLMALHAAQGIDEVLSGRPPTWPVNQL